VRWRSLSLFNSTNIDIHAHLRWLDKGLVGRSVGRIHQYVTRIPLD